MARPRTPARIADVTGARIKNPARYRSRSGGKTGPLGAPPKWLTEAEVEAWEGFRDEMPWLAKSDRTLVALASRLAARLTTEPSMGVSAIAHFRMCLSLMGGTPADRSRVTAPDDGEEEHDEFLN